jgi:tRNA nucleotidyltransferase (CCA-adding enzyme)
MQKDEVLRLFRDPNLVPSEKRTLLSNIAAQAASLNMPCCVVGGFVRDLLLGKPVNDLDIVVEGDAIQLGKKIVEVYGGRLTPHFKFHTAIWELPSSFILHPSSLDLITARKESYDHPGALPTVTPATIADDLRRRDFTINAMALRLDGKGLGEILDPLEGQPDLERGVIRALHPKSFMDDPTRIFRAIRYEGRYSFNMEPSTLNQINPESLAVLSKLSGERLRHELDLIMEEPRAADILLRAAKLGVLGAIHAALPEFKPGSADFLEMDARLDIPADRRTMGYMLWFMDLSEEDVILLANRLDFTNELMLYVWAAAQLKRGLPHLVDMKPSEWTYALENLPPLSIYAVYLVSRESDLLRYLSVWRHISQRATGDDLKSLGLPPGPQFKEILLRLRAAWLDGEVTSETQEKELLAALLK